MNYDLAYKILAGLVLAFTLTMGALGHVMTGGSNIQDVHRAKDCAGYVVFNGERVPKCKE